MPNSKPIADHSVAIITGASRGIGADIATQLSHEGIAVVINYAHSLDQAESLAKSLRAEGGKAIAIQADVSDAGQVEQLFDSTEKHFGKVTMVINNAGVMNILPLAEHSDQLFKSTFAVNTTGTFNMLREASKRMADGGRIINLSSSAVALSLPGYAIYNASKAAVEALTKVFAKELRGRSITVNAIAPGPVATELFFAGKTEEQITTFANMPPLERLGQPQDIAAILSFLVGPDGGWINGQILRANGGII